MNELDEIRLWSYESTRIYKEHTMKWHESHITRKEFNKGNHILLFNSRPKLFPGKLRIRWSGPFRVQKVLPYGAFEMWNEGIRSFKVNG